MVQARDPGIAKGSKMSVKEDFPVEAYLLHDGSTVKITNFSVVDARKLELHGETESGVSVQASGLRGSGEATIHTIL